MKKLTFGINTEKVALPSLVKRKHPEILANRPRSEGYLVLESEGVPKQTVYLNYGKALEVAKLEERVISRAWYEKKHNCEIVISKGKAK